MIKLIRFKMAAVVLLTACRHCRCSCMEAEPVLLRRLLATAPSPARTPLPTTAPPDAPAAQPGATVPPFGLPDITPQATMVWLQQPALPPCADMGVQEIHGMRDYALVFSVVTMFTACSFTMVWLRLRYLRRHAQLTAAGQEAELQPAGSSRCCPCARAAAPHTVLVRGPDEAYSVAVQLSAAPAACDLPAWAPKLQPV